MKNSNISKVAGASLLALSLSVLPLTLPASAQTNNNDANRTTVDTTPFQEGKNDGDKNFGWLGLLGLIGLANLLRKNHSNTHHADRDVVSGTSTRS